MWYRKAQDMSIPYYTYPTQTKNTYENRIPLQKNFQGNNVQEIDNKFMQDAKIYLQQFCSEIDKKRTQKKSDSRRKVLVAIS